METSDYETPASSAAVTPAEPLHSNGSLKANKIGASARALELRASSHALANNRSTSKKRRLAELDGTDFPNDCDDPSAQLALKLQAEEYDAEDLIILETKRRRGSSQIPIDLTESDDDVPLASLRRQTIQAVPNSETSDLSSLDADLSEDEESEFSGIDSVTGSALTGVSDSAPNSFPAASTNIVRSTVIRRRQVTSRRFQASDIDMDSFDPGKRRAKRERARLERAHPEIVTMWNDLKAIEPIQAAPAEQPPGISRKLKSFQLEGLSWMTRQEKSRWKGGLLGDEMGMGKTIQAVSLIMSDYPAKNPTLVVVPPVALMQWQSEISVYTDGKLKVLIYHVSANPKCKLLTPKDIRKYNIIMVSYAGLESMYRKENKGWNRQDGIVKEDSILHSIKYHRLILDEAHSIKSRTTSVAKACFALKADYKWCLSGTPVQNRIGEFFSLLRFLEVIPFACYFCKDCKCKELHWSQNENKM